MLNPAETELLNAWCRPRSLLCVAQEAGGTQCLALQPLRAARAWPRMRLLCRDDGFCLQDQRGDVLATASDLQAVLDALDAGLAEYPAGLSAAGIAQIISAPVS